MTRLILFLTIRPLTQAFQVDVLHGAYALAWCDEWIATVDILFIFEADPATFTGLLTNGCLGVHCLVKWAS